MLVNASILFPPLLFCLSNTAQGKLVTEDAVHIVKMYHTVPYSITC